MLLLDVFKSVPGLCTLEIEKISLPVVSTCFQLLMAKCGQYFHSDVKAIDYICASRRDVSPLLSGEFLGNACERMNAALFFFHRAKRIAPENTLLLLCALCVN